jgi:lysophospholipid acyltransferase (LPLAT)-like uncharacterized protein
MTSSASPRDRVIPHRLTGKDRLLGGLVYWISRTISSTWRVRWEDDSAYLGRNQEPVIYCLWHNRLALCMVIWRRYLRRVHPTAGLVAFISASRDGAYLADVLARYGVGSVRGSTSRRGRQALLEACGWLERGYSVAVTPDGPRGPCYRIQDGILALAQVSGRPIIPVNTRTACALRTKSWDRFFVPLPFSRSVVRLGPPLFIPRDLDDAGREEARSELHRRMTALFPH